VLDDAEFETWFRLLQTPGIGRDKARALLASFGSAPAIFDASPAQWRVVVGPAAATALASPPPECAERLAAAHVWRRGGDARHVVTLGDPGYPGALLQTADPPLLLYVQGQVAALGAESIAIVGSRSPTPQGADNARQFARHLSDAGLAVVSGLALGIDGAAHEGALAGRSATVAVVGTGLDRVYPGRHRDLAHRIAARGAIVSEFHPGTPPLRENFPLRNRIIAGMTRGTLVVEAAPQSGSLITARLAAEAGREVFAIPGSIHSPQSRGCHALIKQGAKLVESGADILDELHWGASRAAAAPTSAPPTPADPVLVAMGFDPVTLDAIGARTGMSTAELGARLLELELEGHVERLPGGLFQRRATA
jgi:DNA processing protein